MSVYGGNGLTLPDEVTIRYPLAAPLMDGRARQPRGRGTFTTVTMPGQYEGVEDKRRSDGTVGADPDSRGTLILSVVECVARSYSPEAGTHQLVAVKHMRTGITQNFALYFDAPTPDGAGELWNVSLRDKEPARKGAAA